MTEALLREICNLHERMANVHFFEEISNLPHGEFLIMKYLHEFQNDREERTITKIAKKYNVTAPAISRTVRSMVDKRWVNRIENEMDRRVIYLSLTNCGETIYKTQANIVQAYMLEVVGLIDNQDIQDWIRIGNIIVTQMNTVLNRKALSEEKEGKN